MGMKHEYIEKDFVLYAVRHFGSMLTWSKEDILAEIERVVKSEKPIGDVARVVWCKDCKHCKKYRNRLDPMRNHQLCVRMDKYAFGVEEDDFCSYGERKGNDST